MPAAVERFAVKHARVNNDLPRLRNGNETGFNNCRRICQGDFAHSAFT